MYKTNFLPYIGTEQIKFDSVREEIRNSLGAYKEFKKTKFSKNTTDDFTFCHVFYDANNKVEAIEYFDTIELLYKEKNLFLLLFTELKSFLKSNSIDYQEDDFGFKSDSIGLSVYSPEKTKIESLLIYKKGYFNY